jgi:hypothetical protein
MNRGNTERSVDSPVKCMRTNQGPLLNAITPATTTTFDELYLTSARQAKSVLNILSYACHVVCCQ